jgi:hypothetical protein
MVVDCRSPTASVLGVFLMKKVLLAGAALVLIATSAHANDKLPDTITGTWCYFEGDNPDPELGGPMVYTGHTRKNCSHALDQIGIRQDGIDEHERICTFDKIVRTGANSFLIYERCEDGNGEVDGGGPSTYELIDGKLVITPLSEG